MENFLLKPLDRPGRLVIGLINFLMNRILSDSDRRWCPHRPQSRRRKPP